MPFQILTFPPTLSYPESVRVGHHRRPIDSQWPRRRSFPWKRNFRLHVVLSCQISRTARLQFINTGPRVCRKFARHQLQSAIRRIVQSKENDRRVQGGWGEGGWGGTGRYIDRRRNAEGLVSTGVRWNVEGLASKERVHSDGRDVGRRRMGREREEWSRRTRTDWRTPDPRQMD